MPESGHCRLRQQSIQGEREFAFLFPRAPRSSRLALLLSQTVYVR